MAEIQDEELGDCVICVTGIFEELQEEDILDVFSEFGPIKNLHLNLDRRTGYAKGYAFIEYEQRKDAEEAIESMNGKEVSGKVVKIDWAFRETPHKSSKSKRSSKRKH